MKDIKEKTIGEIVADDFRTAAVFTTYGIDFCCKGNRTVEEACERKNIDANEVQAKLAEISASRQNNGTDFNSWDLDLLADYIQKKHHRYIEEKTPVLKQYLDKLCKVHGDRHPELFEIAEGFNSSSGELAMHMKKEELVLFPYIRQMVKAKEAHQPVRAPHFMTVKNPIQMMLHEHDVEGDRFQRISGLTDNYNPPADACNTYRVAFAMLKEFEDDLHMHIHLENNILFPKSILLEEELKAGV
jgi:regulator of cell morphogenesis and NO signaling